MLRSVYKLKETSAIDRLCVSVENLPLPCIKITKLAEEFFI